MSVRDTDVVEELRTLIAFPTVSSRPVTAIAAHLAQRCEDLGFHIERFDDPVHEGKTNIVATLGPASAAGGLVISGHMDVVPVANQPWTSDPFVLTARDGRLQARGTADMKGFIAATTVALERLDRRRLTRPLILVWTHDEEVGCHGSAHLAASLLAAGRTLPRDCLIGEPTGLQVLRMHAGHVAVRVTTRGAAAHSAFPELGSNAIEAAALAVGALRRLAAELRCERFPQPDLDRDFVPLNVGVIGGGSAVNIVPDKCVVELGFRPLPGAGHEPILKRIEAALAALSLPAGTSLDCQLIRVTPSLCTPADTPMAGHLLKEAAVPGLGAAGFATDGGNLARCGAEPLVFGPGSIQVAHQADEYIEEAALRDTVGIVERLVLARCCAPREANPSRC
jgi:acetylornithine deacetylase